VLGSFEGVTPGKSQLDSRKSFEEINEASAIQNKKKREEFLLGRRETE